MKVAVLTSRARCEKFTDPALIPEGCEIVWLGQEYTNADVLREAADAEAIIVDAVLPVDAELIAGMKKLKLIHSEGVGYDRIDVAAAKRAGVAVCNNRGVNAGQVAEHAVMLMLAVLHRLSEGNRLVRAGRQIETKTRFIQEGLEDLSVRHVGILGLGAIGRELAKRLRPFGCRVSYFDTYRPDPAAEAELGVSYLPQAELLRTCDVVSLHVPVLPETRGLICRETLALMRPEAILINTARGALVNDADLAEAIMNGTIWGAGLDTMDPEPVPADDPLILMPPPFSDRVIFTPHVAGTTKSVFFSAFRTIWRNIAAVARGEEPVNKV